MENIKACELCRPFLKKQMRRVARFCPFWTCRECRAKCCEHLCSHEAGDKASCGKCKMKKELL